MKEPYEINKKNMCGIVALLNVKEQTQALRDKALKMSQKIRHRGPDWSGIYSGGSAILAHERLSIVGPESGGQPLYSPPPVPPRRGKPGRRKSANW